VNSILAQTFKDFEIVLVDNNPPQNRVDHNRLGRGRHPWLGDSRLRLLADDTPPNAAGARNLGLEEARGDWVTYLDDDDTYHPLKLERQLAAANSSKLPLGVCGTVYYLPCRQRSRCRLVEELSGDDLLLYFLGTPTIFHRRAPEVRFNETLNAGEDVYYFQRLLRFFAICRVFHVPEALVQIYQQPSGHVNLNALAVWRACEATLRDFGTAYSEVARQIFRARARLRFCTLESGHYREILTLCLALVRQQGMCDWRLILNCFLCKIPWLRRWLVH